MDVCVLPQAKMFRTFDGGPPVMFVPKATPYTDTDRFGRDLPPIHDVAGVNSLFIYKLKINLTNFDWFIYFRMILIGT